MLKYKIPQIVTLTLLNPPGLSGEPIRVRKMNAQKVRNCDCVNKVRID